MARLTPLFAILIALGLSAPVLAASQSSEQGTTQQMKDSQYHSKNKTQGPHRMVIGKVTDTRDVQIKGPVGDKHRLLKLNANDNTVIVDLGAMTQETFKDLGIKQGNRIWALGSSARINGKPVIFARYVGEVSDFQGGQRSSQEQGKSSASKASDVARDDYGVYDKNFVFLVVDEDRYDDWYGDASDYWDDYNCCWGDSDYDDPGEAGWFDW